MTRGRGLALALGVGALVRAPFLQFSLRAPIDADTAIIGLMARHPLRSTTMWGQPYGSPLEGWLAAPLMLAIDPGAVAMRLFYALLGLALVAVAYLLAEALDERAALPAALLVACPPSYFLLLAVLPPPLYPSTLLLGGLALLVALHLGVRLARGESPMAGAVAFGLLGGLALWTHLSALGPVAAGGAYLLFRGRKRPLVPVTAGLAVALGSLPLWAVEMRYGSLWKVVRVTRGEEPFAAHFVSLLAALHTTLGGLFGAHTPIVADAHEVIDAPLVVVVALGACYAASLVAFLPRLRRETGARLLAAAALLAVLFFLVPLRSQPHTTRFLVALYLPVTVAVALAWAGTRLLAPMVALVCALNLVGGAELLSAWHRADLSQPPFGEGPVDEVQAFLENQGISRAFADYEIAYRLTFATDERLVVSQPMNERFPGHPLPFLDEVRFAPGLAWVLTPGNRTRLPAHTKFERALHESGGRFRLQRFGPLRVYYAFVPPFDPEVVVEPGLSVPAAGSALVRLPAAPPIAALELFGPDREWARGLRVEASADGTLFETVAHVPPPEFRLEWVNGHPEAAPAPEVLVVSLGGRPLAALRVSQPGPTPLTIERLLLHPAAEGARRAWPEWLVSGSGWPERRAALAAHPRPERADWYLRTRLADEAR